MLEPRNVSDRIGWVSPVAIQPAAFRVLDRLQRMDPAVQIMATAVALCAMSESLGLRMRDVINVAENVLRDSEGPYTTHIQAIRDYAKYELLRAGQ
jgi:hypothetical protein